MTPIPKSKDALIAALLAFTDCPGRYTPAKLKGCTYPELRATYKSEIENREAKAAAAALLPPPPAVVTSPVPPPVAPLPPIPVPAVVIPPPIPPVDPNAPLTPAARKALTEQMFEWCCVPGLSGQVVLDYICGMTDKDLVMEHGMWEDDFHMRTKRYQSKTPADSAYHNREKSTATKPVDVVRGICNANPGMARKLVIALCLEAGVNKNTAATQYSLWKVGVSGSMATMAKTLAGPTPEEAEE